MTSAESTASLETESTSLLGEGAISSQEELEYVPERRAWVQSLWNAFRTTKATLCYSYTHILLIFVPLGIIAGPREWGSALDFTFNFLAILPLASLLSLATDKLSARVGQTFGGLINATFGNAVELIVGITALRQGEIHIVQSSMVGSILSGTLLILGSCFSFAGYGKDTLDFSVNVSGIMSSLMIVSSASLIIPTTLCATYTLSTPLESDDNVLVLSRIASIVLLLFYIIYLYFQLVSHASLFGECILEDDESHELGPWAACVVIVISTVGISVCSDSLIDSVDGLVKSIHVSRAFIGMILVPIVGNAGEYVTAVNAAMDDKLGLAIGVVVGATLQIALFVTPFMVILGWIIGQPMSLRFETFETTVFFLAVIMVNCLIHDGRTNYFEGVMLIGTYFLIAIAFLVHPDVVNPHSS